MEPEKSIERIEAEKKAMDESGYSELQADLQVNRQPGDGQHAKSAPQGKKIFQQQTNKENVLLENKRSQ